jgi:hypothetical protein
MNQVAITATKGSSTRRKLVKLPTDWHGVADAGERLRLLRMLLTNPGDLGRIIALMRLLGLKRKEASLLSPEQVRDLLAVLDWLRPVPDARPLVDAIGKGKYHLPTAMEYAIADEYFGQFAQGDAKALPLLVATLARPQRRSADESARLGDVRIPLHSRSEIEARSKLMEELPLEQKMVVVLYWAGVKQYVHETYAGWIFPTKEELEAEGNETAQKGDLFGWWGVFMSVAEANVFGNLEAVHHANFHEICMYLVKKKQEAKEATSRLPSASAPAASEF